MSKRIITAALTGAIHTPSMSPYLPVTPKQIIEDAVRSYEAGASIVHIHVRDPETGLPNADQNIYREIAENIRKQCNVVMCFTTGGKLGEPVENRVRVASNLKPELTSLNAGSLNFALFHIKNQIKEFKHDWEETYLDLTEDYIFPNTFKTMRQYLEIIYANGARPEFEIYDVGMINNVAFMLQKGIAKQPVYLQFVMGILGGIPASADNLLYMIREAKRLVGEKNFIWSVCAAGRFQFNMGILNVLEGGQWRVGLEDNLYLEKGVLAKNSAEQVEKAIRIIREFGYEPATEEEARKMLKLKGQDKVNY